MTVELTTTQVNNLKEFLELCLFDFIRKDTEIDSMYWLVDMVGIYNKLSNK